MTKIPKPRIHTTKNRTNRFPAAKAVAVAVLVATNLLAGAADRIGAQEPHDLYRRLSVELSEESWQLENTDARRELARRAAELDPSLGDPFLILARLLDGDQGAIQEREHLLLWALAGDFVTFDRDDAVGDLTELLILQRRFQDALSLLDEELSTNGRAPLDRILEDGFISGTAPLSRLDRLYVTALIHGDAPWLAGRLLQRLRAHFPRDLSLAEMDWDRGDHVSLAVLEWIDAVEVIVGAVSAEMYRELLRSDVPEPLVPLLRDRYSRSDGEDPLVAAIAVAHGYEDLLPTGALLSDKLIWELLLERRDRTNMPDAILDALEEIRRRESVVLHRDDNRDGYWEERYRYRNGELAFWQFDGNQDGRVSQSVRVEGPAAKIAVRREDEDHVILVEYTTYPLVSRVRWVASSGGREWIPSQPVPFDIGISGVFNTDLWNALGSRVTVGGDPFERFQRQRHGDGSHTLRERDLRETREELQEWGLVE